MQDITQKTHAIVIGGGIAGLLAARVLTNHFERVTLIERDHYPDEPKARPGTPQGRQVHNTLLKGQQTLEALFPGLAKKLLLQGAVERDYSRESLYYYGGRCPQVSSNLHGWNCSRFLLEWQIRQELKTYPQLDWREGHEVVHLLYDQQSRAVTGVQLRVRNHQQNNALQDVLGDLVIDASGASSSIFHWLKELGYPTPKETTINAALGYATRFYQRPPDRLTWKAIAIQATEDRQRGGALMGIEGDRWMVVLSGIGEDAPPTDEEDYLEFARSLPEPALYEAIKEATPLSPIYGYRRTENRLRHFEQVQLPNHLLIMGDAICCFNPLYGQGMTVAALEALTLDACLHEGQKSLASFQSKVARLLTFPWQLATASDARTSSGHPKGLSHRYVESLVKLLPSDQSVLLTFLEVIHMLRSPRALMHPTILMKVVRAKFL